MSIFEEEYKKAMRSIVAEDLFRLESFDELFRRVEEDGELIDVPAQEVLDMIGCKHRLLPSQRDLRLSIFVLEDYTDIEKMSEKVRECWNKVYGYDVFEKYPKSLGAICTANTDKIIRAIDSSCGLTHYSSSLDTCIIFVAKDYRWKTTLAHEIVHFVQRATGTNILRPSLVTALERGEIEEIDDKKKRKFSIREAVPYFNGICYLLEKLGADTHFKALKVIDNLVEIADASSDFEDFKKNASNESILFKLRRRYVKKTGERKVDAAFDVLMACVFYRSHVNTIKTLVGSYFTE